MIPHQNGRSEARQPDSLTFADQHRWREVQLTADVSPSAAHRLATASAVERKPAGDEKEGGGGRGFGKLERLRDGERKLAGSRIWQELGGDWFVGFVQPPEAGEPFGREGSSPGGTD